MSEEGSAYSELEETEVQPASALDVWATVLCWVAFVVGAVFVPARSVVLGGVAELSLFGAPLTESDRAEAGREFLVGSISATAVAAAILAIALVFLARGRRLDGAWVAGVLSAGAAALSWAVVVLHPAQGI